MLWRDCRGASWDFRLWLAAALAFLVLCLAIPRRVAAQEAATAELDAGGLVRLEQAFQDTIARVAPSVVGLRIERSLPANSQAEPAGGTKSDSGSVLLVSGTGTIIDREGLILTNEHVVQAAGTIEVLFADGAHLPATIVASDARSDLAVLRVARTGLTSVQFCDWSSVARGQWAFTLGNPYGLGADGQLSTSVGVIANLGRSLPGLGEVDDRLYHDMIQTTAAIHPGNSGGPLFNLRGEMIGVITAMHARAADDDGVGFAIPLSPAKRRILARLQQGLAIEYGYLGLSAQRPGTTTPSGASDSPSPSGAEVVALEPHGPADESGLAVGDVIHRFAGAAVRAPGQLAELLADVAIGQPVEIEWLRAGRVQRASVAVALRHRTQIDWLRSGTIEWRGVRLANLTPAAHRRMGVGQDVRGVVVLDFTPQAGSVRAVLRRGDVVERAASAAVPDVHAFRSAVLDRQDEIALQVRGRGEVVIPPATTAP